MQTLHCTLYRFDKQGEKTGWTYIVIPADVAQRLNPHNKKSFRVKGTMDNHTFNQVALLPMGEGEYIMPINNIMRKALKKKEGDVILLKTETDESEFILSPDMLACLEEEASVMKHFNSLAGSHQRYFSKWIESAKTWDTKTDRIAKTFFAMQKQMDYGAMIRYFQGKK
ncbi:MAG: YdeI/OmpD-associated family protein [Flavobacteriales bacterium]|nr:YdeI/OmpD-associated family protein [Flavobacteriales bacterium]